VEVTGDYEEEEQAIARPLVEQTQLCWSRNVSDSRAPKKGRGKSRDIINGPYRSHWKRTLSSILKLPSNRRDRKNALNTGRAKNGLNHLTSLPSKKVEEDNRHLIGDS